MKLQEVKNEQCIYFSPDAIDMTLSLTQIGVSAPQGSGKTTLVSTLDFLFRVAGR
jgi:Ni2+-binding GTPase involved in maturation of urease and hydrogenase